MELSGKRVLVIGLGRSGRAASKKLSALGARVIASDASVSAEMMRVADELRGAGMDVHLGQQGERLLEAVDLVVVSPGVPSRVPVIEAARAGGIPVWSEIELAYRLTGVPIIAISGTNGKTTTTTLIGKVFDEAGRRAAVAGNIGIPLATAVDDPDLEALIVEVSSFQLDTIEEFRPKISVLLNITEDHLDWHPDFDDYVRAKHRLFLNQGEDDVAVLNFDDDVVRSLVPGIRARVVATSKQELESGICIREGRIVLRGAGDAGEEVDVCGAGELKIRGNHNLDNVMAVIGTCLSAGIDMTSIRRAVTEFPGLPHRIEHVATINGVAYYNDSKATNVDATVKALTAFHEPTILLVGGRNKGNSFIPLAQSIDMKVQSVIGFGEAGREILSVMPSGVHQEYAETVEDAVVRAGAIARPGYVVLFSPACASFDAFSGYAQRGEVFKNTVLGLGDLDGTRER